MTPRPPRASLATILAVSAVLLGAGCASTPRIVSSDELDSQERRILELEREVQRAHAEASALRQRVAELERALPPAAPPEAAAAPPVPPITPEPEPPEATALTPELAPSAPISPQVAIEESDLAVEAPPADAPGASSYEGALTLLREHRYEEAERALERFAAEQPGSDLADNAWFWIGESRLARGDAAGAVLAYRTAIERYPEGNKMPDTLLKLGTALAAAGETESAREAWRELVRRFPTSAAAEAATLRLEAQ